MRIIRPAVSLRTAAIVLQINYQSVLKELLLLQLVDNPADATIHDFCHGCIGFHAADIPSFMLEPLPVETLGHGPLTVDDAHFDRLLVASFADCGVALVVDAFVFCDIGLRRVHGPVGAGVGDVEKEWLIRYLAVPAVIGDEGDRIVVDGVGVVEGFRLILRVILGSDVGVTAAEGGGVVEAACSCDGPVKAVEAALYGPG